MLEVMSWSFMLIIFHYISFLKIICHAFKIFLVFINLNFDTIMNNVFRVIKIFDNNIF